MRLPWRKPPEEGEHPNPERVRKRLAAAKAQRPDVERLRDEIREQVRRNNFAANVFALAPKEKP